MEELELELQMELDPSLGRAGGAADVRTQHVPSSGPVFGRADPAKAGLVVTT